MGGVFWGLGVYYSPSKNITNILKTTENEQVIERELEGYHMIDIIPPIGADSMNSSTGIKGKTLNSLASML